MLAVGECPGFHGREKLFLYFLQNNFFPGTRFHIAALGNKEGKVRAQPAGICTLGEEEGLLR